MLALTDRPVDPATWGSKHAYPLDVLRRWFTPHARIR